MAERKGTASLWQWVFEAGEEKLGQLADEILSSPHITEALAAALTRAAQTKGKVDRNLQLLLGALNLPSRQDLTKLQSKIEALQGSLVNLNIKVDRLMASLEPRKRPAPPRAPRTPHEPDRPPREPRREPKDAVG